MRIRTAALAALIAVGFADAQTMSIEEYEPKSTLVVPEHGVTRAKYPFVDVHNHQNIGMSKEELRPPREGHGRPEHARHGEPERDERRALSRRA